MNDTMLNYIPQDRLYTLTGKETLAEWSKGAALFADISGFTPLTEALVEALGPQLGAEEMTRQINQLFDDLIAASEQYGGSIIAFGGDAITCWFASEGPGFVPQAPAPLRAVACALAMQTVMQRFTHLELPNGAIVSLALKVSVASGPARRMLVGNPEIQIIDVLAGDTTNRMVAGEHIARKGEVIVDAPTVAALATQLNVSGWRTDSQLGERFALVDQLLIDLTPGHWQPLVLTDLPEEQVRPWLLRAVYVRLQAGLGEMLTELRPVVALFLNFSGLDYTSDPEAHSKLDAYVQWVQGIIEGYAGTLVQLTIGDKGNYVYAAFGAPSTHEDDARRALSAALDLQQIPAHLNAVRDIRIGISQGQMRVGSYGGTTRRSYGVLGDEVNLAARLMQRAAAGAVLGSERIQQASAGAFEWDSPSKIQVKGKREPVIVARLRGRTRIHSATIAPSGPLVGREMELAQCLAFLEHAATGRFAGVLAIYGEPGIGKTQLASTVQRQLLDQYQVRWFTCTAEPNLNQSLAPFRQLLRDYFNQEGAATVEEAKQRFTAIFDTLLASAQQTPLAEALERAASFLGALIDLHWHDTLYERLEPQLRFENTLAAIQTLLFAESLSQPIVLHIEDAQWLDNNSRMLLRVLTRNANNAALALLLTSRYGRDGSTIPFDIDPDLPQSIIELDQLSPTGIQALASDLLGSSVSPDLVALLAARTSGNPLFVEQLLLDMRERDLLHPDPERGWHVVGADLPTIPESISAVLIARLDRLAVPVKATVQGASVLGQEFELPVLQQMFCEDTEIATKVQQATIEGIWNALSENHYLFRHAMLCDAAYSMQVRSRLRTFHSLAAIAIEQLHDDDLSPHYVNLAYHYGKAEDQTREHLYARQAGEQAAANFANLEAITYLSRALALTLSHDLETRYDLLRAREQVYEVQSQHHEQRADLDELTELVEQLPQGWRQVDVLLRRADYTLAIGDYPAAKTAVRQALELSQIYGYPAQEAASAFKLAQTLWAQADYKAAREQVNRALELAHTHAIPAIEADSLRTLGNVAAEQGDFATAQQAYQQSLQLAQSISDQRGQSAVLNNLGNVAAEVGDFPAARSFYERALDLDRATGDRRGESLVLDNLGVLALEQGDYLNARKHFERSLQLCREIGDRQGESLAFDNLGSVAAEVGDYTTAQDAYQRCLRIDRELDDQWGESTTLALLGLLAHHRGDHESAQTCCVLALLLAQEIGTKPTQATALTILGHILLARNEIERAAEAYEDALNLWLDLGEDILTVEPMAGLAQIALHRGQIAEALTLIETILPRLMLPSLDHVREPFRVRLTCYQVLFANTDPRANVVLATSYQLLQQRAAQIDDETLQHSYLETVPTHRALIAAYQNHSLEPTSMT